MDYEKIGFKSGLEIHQQLDTKKLFCSCQSEITEDIDYSFERFLCPTQSEMGDIDKAALLEAKKNRRFLYTASDKSTCLVEADEEPPHTVNQEALDVCLTTAVLLKADVVDEIHFMRKLVIDGSNTSGFQRTALVGLNGEVENVGIQTIALEEDSARKLKEKDKLINYGLDRLGIPLIEIATNPDIKNPEHAQEVAERIGMLLRATGKTKKGLGTIRQDLNISISEGARVEIKGVQSLSSISRVLEKETRRQLGLLEIKKVLEKREIKKQDVEKQKTVDITDILEKSDSKMVKKQIKKGCGKAICLPGFKDLLKKSDTRLGKEFAVHARVNTGIGGILHSDELPGYGLKQETVDEIHKKMDTKEKDAFVIAAGDKKTVNDALETVKRRAELSFNGPLEEVRRAMPDDTTEYMRPLPGAARMYPETDVPPQRITEGYIQKIEKNLPEKPEEKHKRFKKQYDLNEEQTHQILASGYEDDFEKLVEKFPKQKNTVFRTFLNTIPELEDEDVDIEKIGFDVLQKVFRGLSDEKFAKEAVPKLLKFFSKQPSAGLKEAVEECGVTSVGEDKVAEIVKNVVSEKEDFIEERGEDALGPLMGVVMKKLRGKADGQKVSMVLREEIKKILEM
ncbi:MAG: Glu-tRNA(Gln) amidotransferase subunit GatE [Candidatus Thermoplasmatota archaeon]